MGTPEYFTDQYGHIYRWQATDTGAQSVSVANFQKHGSRAESERMIDKANTAPDLLAALETSLAWVQQYHNLKGHEAASYCMATVIEKALAKASGA